MTRIGGRPKREPSQDELTVHLAMRQTNSLNRARPKIRVITILKVVIVHHHINIGHTGRPRIIGARSKRYLLLTVLLRKSPRLLHKNMLLHRLSNRPIAHPNLMRHQRRES